MITGETWTEQVSFEGCASAVILVTGVQECPASRYEFRLESLALDCYMKPFAVAVYIWDDRPRDWCREFYSNTFKEGSVWRISGKIAYDMDSVVFVDPVYMPYSGAACARLIDALQQNKE